MKLTAKSTDERIVCFYNSNSNNDKFIFNIDDKAIQISRFDLRIIINTLQKFDEMMTICVRRK